MAFVCVYCWMKRQMVIYYNNQADGTRSCLHVAADTVATPAEAMKRKRLQPADKPRCESIQDLSRVVMTVLLTETQTGLQRVDGYHKTSNPF